MTPDKYILNAEDGNRGEDWELPDSATRESTDLPDSFSRRKLTPRVLNQGPVGSCVGQSLRTVFGDTHSNRPFELSPMWIYRKSQFYDIWPGENYSGTSITGACNALRKEGVCTEDFWPYEYSGNTNYKTGAPEDANRRKIHAFYRIGADRTEDIKRLLKSESLAVSIHIHEEFYSANRSGMINEQNYLNSARKGGHAIALIGWKYINGALYWELQNSWGTTWGDKGYFFMSDDLLRNCVKGSIYYLVTQEEEAERLKKLNELNDQKNIPSGHSGSETKPLYIKIKEGIMGILRKLARLIR